MIWVFKLFAVYLSKLVSRQLVLYVIFDFKDDYFVEKQGFRIFIFKGFRQYKRHGYGGSRKKGERGYGGGH